MSGSNVNGVYTETFGTTSPVSGSAPTSATDGQPLANLASIELQVSAAAGTTLSGAGSLACYVEDPSVNDPNGSALANGTLSGSTLAYDEGGAAFQVGQTVTGQTSGAHGVVASLTSTVLTLSSISGAFVDNEVLVGVSPPLWVRLPSADFTATLTTRSQAFTPVIVAVPRKEGRIKWVPVGVTFAAGSGGITVRQVGQTSFEFFKVQGRQGAL